VRKFKKKIISLVKFAYFRDTFYKSKVPFSSKPYLDSTKVFRLSTEIVQPFEIFGGNFDGNRRQTKSDSDIKDCEDQKCFAKESDAFATFFVDQRVENNQEFMEKVVFYPDKNNFLSRKSFTILT
jgi:hypothetical protein